MTASLTNTRASPIFNVTAPCSGPCAALASVTVTATGAVVVLTMSRCAACGYILMGIPGTPLIEVRKLTRWSDASGRGRVVHCTFRDTKGGRRCSQVNEVLEHGTR